MTGLWIYAAGAVLMAALGPSPRWLAAEFMEDGGRELTEWKMWVLWSAQILLWPVALAWLARGWLYGH